MNLVLAQLKLCVLILYIRAGLKVDSERQIFEKLVFVERKSPKNSGLTSNKPTKNKLL